MSERASRLLGHFESNAAPLRHNKCSAFQKGPDDIVVISCKRTACTRARKGGFKDTLCAEMLAPVLKEVIKDINPSLVSEVCVGSVLPPSGHRHVECRHAAFLAGMPETTTVRTVNRQCSSGLQAIADVASDIKAGYYEIGIAAGVETMTANVKQFRQAPPISNLVKSHPLARSSLIPMGNTSENVAKRFGITREMQDTLAVMSHARAAAARQKFKSEIVPVKTIFKDLKTNKATGITVCADDGIRDGTSMESLAKLRPAFTRKGTSTAGNSSQVSDGAAACLLMKRSKAEELGLQPMATFSHFAVAGVPPEIMGIGPAYAIPKVLDMAGMSLSDIDLFEINEAFASQAVYCVNKLGLSMDNVNVNGGAIALGHPLGMTGTRMTATLLHEMKRRGSKTGVVSMCIGTGMGAAGIFIMD